MLDGVNIHLPFYLAKKADHLILWWNGVSAVRENDDAVGKSFKKGQ